MTMKRVALTLALMMLVGTLATPLLSEFNDELPMILDDEGTDVMNAGRGSGYEYVDIDHSGYVFELDNGTEVWASGSTVVASIESGGLAIGENYTLEWSVKLDNATWNVEQSGNISWTATSNFSIDVVNLSGLADGYWRITAILFNSTGLGGAVDMTRVIVGASGFSSFLADLESSCLEADDELELELSMTVPFEGNISLPWELMRTGGQILASGSPQFTIGANHTLQLTLELDLATLNLSDGNYTLRVDPTYSQNSSYVFPNTPFFWFYFQIGCDDTNGSGACEPTVSLSTRHHDTGLNQTEFIYDVDVYNSYALHSCLDAGLYDWKSEVYDDSGFLQYVYDDGDFYIDQDGSFLDLRIRNFEADTLPPGTYYWYYTFYNTTVGVSEWANHTFTVVDSTASQSCSELETERLQQYYYAEESAVNTILVDCPAVGEAIEVYWKVTQYQDGTIMDDGWWNTTATSTSMSHTVETDDLPIGVWYAFSATMYTDNGTLYEWHSFNIVPSYNPNPGPDEVCGESNAQTSIHVTNDANTNTYMGHEYYSDDDFNHEISLDCLITNSTYEVEYILTHYHTGYLVDSGWWNFTATGPTASITETWSNLPIQIWYAVTAMYTFDNGVTISAYEKFYVNSTTGPELLGYCSFPTFEATPATVQSGDDLTFTWTMDGDVTDDVYLSLHSGWGAQYYFSSVEDNDGSHTITLPANMNPNEDYTVYIESASSGQRTTVCWKYGSIDVLEDDEGVVLDDIINDFLNTTDERPRISMWYGKVNQHNENGTWMTDPDGVAGAGLYSQWGSEGWGDRKLEYCQRFWPDTVEIRNSAPEEIVFYTRGNTDAYLTMKPVWLCVQDTDGDGILDPEDEDDDGDGWPDIFEDLCFSDALDPNVMPEDLDGDGLCDVLQVLLVGDFEPPEPGFCTDGEITGGNGLVGQDVYTELVVVEKTGGTNQYQYEIHDWSNELHEDLQQDASNHDFRGYYEYYDVFLSDADGTFNPNGSFVTVQARSDLTTTNLGVGHNIDAIGIRDANGNVLYASEVLAVVLGDGLGNDNPDGHQTAILGPADEIPTRLGNNQASITVGFCPTLVDDSDEPSPGFGAMAALAALGAAMFAGRRGLLDEQDAE